ncbi:hypothetical protein DACRYDRAFT_116038 [Dacryopinax primogenitus]|uniref:F-box domain-containing protein n=1 Tax=Dacryopinax primogenitus (strain DJM 731) TaxID=1858805 RepID=M5G271_DACPD|nr:uncharacterized protein DACRYDRAFT_116038 [Dacryopinax primogenitus]EJU02315.1 hypothetical protein DACRYDRAFT_116038 [Dacryopinax primogenitus]
MPTLPTELWLLIVSPLVDVQYALSAPQPADVQRTLHALSLTSRQLNAVPSQYIYDCIWIRSHHALSLLLAHYRRRRVRTLIYSGPLRSFPLDDVHLLLTHVAPTLERLFLSLSLGMPLATYNNPLLLLRPTLQLCNHLRELGSFSNASDELLFPLRRTVRRALQPAPDLLTWPGVERVALVNLNMGSALQLAHVLPNLKSVALPAQGFEEGLVYHLQTILHSLPPGQTDLVWVRHKDNTEEGESGAWFLFHFLPLVERLASDFAGKVRMWLLHAPVGRVGLGWWMMQRMLQGEMWMDMGIRLGGDREEGKSEVREE